MLRRSAIRKVSGGEWLEDEGIEADLGGLVNMSGRDQLGCPDSQCVCEQCKDYSRGGELAKSLRNGRTASRASIDISEIGRRAGSRRAIEWVPVRIVNERQGEDLTKTIREARPREEYARGWLMPNARRGGISMNSSGRLIWDGDFVEEDSVYEENRRWGTVEIQARKRRRKGMQLLTKWDCDGEEVAK